MNVEENIKRGCLAIEEILQTHGEVKGAMERPETGAIAFCGERKAQIDKKRTLTMRMLSYVPHLLLTVRFPRQSRILCYLNYTCDTHNNQPIPAVDKNNGGNDYFKLFG